MKFRDYAASKVVTLCFIGIGALLSAAFLTYGGAGPALVGTAELFLFLLVSLWLICGYLTERNKLRKLNKTAEDLQEKYLLGELLPPPSDIVERQYFEIMKTISRSAIGVAERAVREKEEYCDYVESWVHEIKTPLTACSLILSNGGEIGKLKKELKRADNLTESILYYARLRTAEKDVQIQKIHAAPVLNEAVQSQMELLIAAGISVEIEGDFTVYTDGKTLAFIIKQLLINCAKYCPGCHIVITAEKGVISVRDDGIGIPKQDLRRVTERGFTGSNGRRLGGSTGMGLYIVKELCRQMEIALSITSEEGKYTCVSLAFGSLTKV